MSIFPFISPEVLEATSKADLPLFKEYAYDFENNRLLLKNGNTYLVEGNEALRIWIFKALLAERYRYTAYDADFGSEIHTLIGSRMDDEIALSELKRYIIEALMVNPYIVELSNFEFSRIGSGVKVVFDCETVYGTEQIMWDAKGVWTP